MTRAGLAALLAESPALGSWEIYAEPPEQLAGRPSIVVAPRSPYQSWETFAEIRTHLTIHLLVPRAHGPAMDLLDVGLAALRELLAHVDADLGIGDVSGVALLDELGGAQYVSASLEVDVT